MQNTINIIRESLSAASDSRGNALYEEREIRSIIDLLLEEVCGLSRVDRVLHPSLALPDQQRETLLTIAQKLKLGQPVQQALEYAWFCGTKFRVTSDVLIPRPETAELVDWIVTSSGTLPHLRICDIGTGSGCIALSLARLLPQSEVTAIDVSDAALSVASANALDQQLERVKFVQQNILEATPNDLGTFDIIVSNPPYICRKEGREMSDIVLKNEPELALFVPDDDPLLFYRTIAQLARNCLSPQGRLFFEINAAYGSETCQMLAELGFTQVELRQDINGRDRMIFASL